MPRDNTTNEAACAAFDRAYEQFDEDEDEDEAESYEEESDEEG